MLTSILDRMNGSLCDALTGQDGRPGHAGGPRQAEPVPGPARRPPPVVPLPPPLRRRAAGTTARRAARPGRGAAPAGQRLVRERTATASRRSGTPWPVQDFAGAADLVELEMPALRRDRREATLRAWLEMLPSDVLQVRPVLCMGLAGTRMSTGTIEGVESLLLDAQRCAGRRAPSDMVVVDHEAFRRLPADVAVHRAGLALMHGDVDSTVVLARSALDLALDDDLLAQGAASALMGLAAWRHGDLETAYTSYAESVRHVRADRAHRRRARLLDHAGRPPADQGSAARRDRHLRPRAAARRRPGGCGAARDGGHARGQERPPLRARRPGRRPAGAAHAASSSATTTGCRRTPIAAGW